jgi:membrane associated rhomboid family serine protease
MSEPDLFVVCKNCSSEVSPYVTECPYCGQRVRKRAPKIEREERREQEPRPQRPPRLSRLRREEMPGIAVDSRPVATIALVALSLAAVLAWSTGQLLLEELGALIGPLDGEAWRLATTPFVYENLGYAFAALVGIGIFGSLLERRFGAFTAVSTFVLSGAAGAGLALLAEDFPAVGGNGAALGLLCAWLVEDRLAARRGDDRENDLLGVAVLGVLLALIPLAEPTASFAAGAGGAAAGALAGLVLGTLRR